MSCRVRDCRHPTTHTTVAHRCGSCGEFGHGQIECRNVNLRDNLKKFYYERINFLRKCTVPNCPNPHTHSAVSHHCSKCGNRHQEDNCIIQNLDVHRNRFTDDYVQYFNEMNFLSVHGHENTVVPIQLGMGCQLFIRIKGTILTSLFMHSDSWGQYGESEDYNVYRKYVDGCNMLEVNSFCQIPEPPEINNIVDDLKIECPLCRTINLESQVLVAYGLTNNCSVCLEKNANRFFQNCGHAPVCDTCFDLIEKN